MMRHGGGKTPDLTTAASRPRRKEAAEGSPRPIVLKRPKGPGGTLVVFEHSATSPFDVATDSP